MADDKKAAADTQAPAAEVAPEPTAPAADVDETTPGGKYRTQAGDFVDAEGNPVKG